MLKGETALNLDIIKQQLCPYLRNSFPMRFAVSKSIKIIKYHGRRVSISITVPIHIISLKPVRSGKYNKGIL